MTEIEQIAAFSVEGIGGNAAAVLFFDGRLPHAREMQAIAADVGFSEAVFAVCQDE
jgi:predicted PhzF superfamily epimerase YddE/YHI9